MAGMCSRCGQSGHIEYGSDGLSYCNSCIFYGLNKPCWKCRMYLPAAELQQYRGQWTCPNCIMDLQDEVRRGEERRRDRELPPVRETERCERCGRSLSMVYTFHGKRLCSVCADQEKGDQWKGSERPPMTPYRIRVEQKEKSSIVHVVRQKIEAFIGRKKHTPPEKPPAKDEKKGTGKKDALLSEGLSKTSGIKYELEPYKDMPMKEPLSSLPKKRKQFPQRKKGKPTSSPSGGKD